MSVSIPDIKRNISFFPFLPYFHHHVLRWIKSCQEVTKIDRSISPSSIDSAGSRIGACMPRRCRFQSGENRSFMQSKLFKGKQFRIFSWDRNDPWRGTTTYHSRLLGGRSMSYGVNANANFINFSITSIRVDLEVSKDASSNICLCWRKNIQRTLKANIGCQA